jgi:hypothetical protein
MGKVPIWGQWLMIAVDVLVSPVFVPLVTGFIGWSRLRRFCARREVTELVQGALVQRGFRCGLGYHLNLLRGPCGS